MGTQMRLHRYSQSILDWQTTEYVVDQEFLDTYGNTYPTFPVGYPYTPNLGLIEVYLNGQFLHAGGGYEELTDDTIRLDLGKNADGSDCQLEVGDEIYIKVYRNQYCSRGAAPVSGTEVYDIKKQLHDVQAYLEIDTMSSITTTINTRFESLRREFEFDEFGDYEVSYTYNSIGKIETETVTKGNGTVRTFTYNTTTGKIEKEEYSKEGQTLTKTYAYNANGKIEKVTVRNT